jgi:hypothetical protein
MLLLLYLVISKCSEEIASAEIYVGNTMAPVAILIQPEPYQYIAEQEEKQEEDYSAKIKQLEEEHYYATKVWEYLRQEGFNQEVTCAIIGNMMIETSGGALDLNPTIYSPSGNYYGLCQWSKKYCPDAQGLSFEQQLDYLLETMQLEFNTFGWLYAEDFNYEGFLEMTDPAEAALAFAKSYERCSSVSYEMRQEAAEKAYEYFDLNKP